MKYKIILALLIYFLSPLYALEGVLVNVDGIFLNSLKHATDAEIKIKWSDYDNQETISFQRHTRSDFVFNQLNPDELNQLRNILKKYLEWHEKASKNNVSVSKVIDTINPSGSLKGWFENGNYKFTENMTIYFKFASSDSETHYLLIHSPKLIDNRNEFIKYDPEIIFLEKEAVTKVLQALSPNAIQNTIKELREQKAVEDSFK